MILDFDRRILFLKSTKTAGTSIEIVLSRFCGQNSVITPTVDEGLRAAHGALPPQNYSAADQKLDWSRELREFDVPPWGRLHFFNHISLEQVISQIGIETFEGLFSFGFTRHPVARALSSYTWLASCNRAYYQRLSFVEHRSTFREMLHSNFESTRKWLSSDSYGVEVTRVYQYEQMQSAMEDIFERLGLSAEDQPPLPTAKADLKGVLGFPREELIDKEALALIEKTCNWEFSRYYSSESTIFLAI